MFWFILFLISICAALTLIPIDLKASRKATQAHHNLQNSRGGSGDQSTTTLKLAYAKATTRFYFANTFTIFSVVLTIGTLIALTAGTISNYNKSYELRSERALLPTLVSQKEDLVSIIRDELSADQLAALVDATDVDSVLVILGNPSGPASQILIERASTIISLNSQIAQARYSLFQNQLSYCNEVDNMFFPRFPGVSPDCPIDFSQLKD